MYVDCIPKTSLVWTPVKKEFWRTQTGGAGGRRRGPGSVSLSTDLWPLLSRNSPIRTTPTRWCTTTDSEDEDPGRSYVPGGPELNSGEKEGRTGVLCRDGVPSE